MKMNKVIKNNLKLYIAMTIVIIFGTMGISYAIKVSNFNPIAINTTAATIDADITYDTGYSANISNTGNMLPISDSLVTGPNITDTRVVKVKFNVSGLANNPVNTIFDIALYATNIDCELRTSNVKWRLYRSTTLISEGNLSPTFDTMNNNRLVLTKTQEDLTTTPKNYTFLLWISESCTGNITTCDPSQDQTKYLNKSLSGTIKVELSTKSKKTLVRTTGSALSCDYTKVAVPICNNLTYNGSEQELVNTTSSTYTLNNNIGIDAGNYPVILSLSDGYKWADGSTDDKYLYCSINKKDVTITTFDQAVDYGTNISNTSNNYSNTSLVNGHTLKSVSLTTDIYDVGTGTISSNNAKIVDSSGNDVTNNYNIKYQNIGTVTINCIKSSVVPTASDKLYTGSNQTGITGGNNVTINGTKSATQVGKYSVVVTPNTNYCWSDGTTTSKTLYWDIKQTYTISYDANGGSGAPSSQTKVHGETLILSSTVPTREEYTFLGWSTSKTASDATYSLGEAYTINSSATLYAVWKANSYTYTITLDKKGGTDGTTGSIYLKYGSGWYSNLTGTTRIYSITPPIKNGYTFEGYYYTNSSGTESKIIDASGTILASSTAFTGNNTIYAKWKANSYTYNIVYKSSSGVSLGTGTISKDYDTTNTVSPKAFTGYTSPSAQSITWDSTSAKTITFTYTPINYSITYTLNGGSVSTANKTSYNIETATFTLNNPTKTGYTFTGWTGSNGTTLQTSVSIAKGSTGNKSYTANWKANSYTYNIVYKSSSGVSLGTGTISKDYGTTNTVSPTAFTGYTSPSAQSITWDSTSAKTITFTYTPISYSITYTLNGGSVSGNPSSYTVETNTFTLNNPTSTGCTFSGWTGSNGTTPQTSVSIAKGSTGNKSYTANWTPNTYKITYNANGGSGAPANQSYTYDSSGKGYIQISKTIPTRSGYVFLGWNTSSSATSARYDPGEYHNKNNASDLNLYAVWQSNDVYYCASNKPFSKYFYKNGTSYCCESQVTDPTDPIYGYGGGYCIALT